MMHGKTYWWTHQLNVGSFANVIGVWWLFSWLTFNVSSIISAWAMVTFWWHFRVSLPSLKRALEHCSVEKRAGNLGKSTCFPEFSLSVILFELQLKNIKVPYCCGREFFNSIYSPIHQNEKKCGPVEQVGWWTRQGEEQLNKGCISMGQQKAYNASVGMLFPQSKSYNVTCNILDMITWSFCFLNINLPEKATSLQKQIKRQHICCFENKTEK